MDHTLQNRPGFDLDGLVRVWPNVSGLVASWCAEIIEPGFWQDAPNPLPVSDFQIWLHASIDVLGHIVQNQPRSDLVLSSGFGQTDLVQKQASVQESSSPLLVNASKLIWIGSGIFTGITLA